MASRVRSWLSVPSLIRTVASHVRLTLRLLREPRVPLLLKAWPVVAVVYVVSPLDLIPDVIPVLGQLDDLTLMLVALESFLKLCPPGLVEFHRAAMEQGRAYSAVPVGGEVIDAEFRRDEDAP